MAAALGERMTFIRHANSKALGRSAAGARFGKGTPVGALSINAL